MTKRQRAYLIHGTSTRDDDWFPWLEQAAKPDIIVSRLTLPEPFNPDPSHWQDACDAQIEAKPGMILVAHSLGCITALRYVERHQVKDVRLLLVGAFDQGLPDYPQLNSFVQPPIDYGQVKPKLAGSTVICAQNDPIAPYQDGVAVSQRIGAKLIVQPTGGHFLSSDGYQEFPLALKELQRLANL
ncbi:RBBP9/YdeN family alpha/beta hydrolase [Limosilactobacillus sp.]|uniref:RBBP9/YdeN family alpha/beta hydrolase n=1 Tax=Limosilactobacillus sp. TaxID=2773925 RepID=UPI00345E59EA